MLVDRTYNAVVDADALRKKMQAGDALTTEEQAQFERGACTITMLNRINAKITELEDILNGYAYMVDGTLYTNSKAHSGLLTAIEYNNIFLNLNKLKMAFYVYSTTPNTPAYLYDFQSANNIEKILVDIESMITDMSSRFRECNTFECGEVNIL